MLVKNVARFLRDCELENLVRVSNCVILSLIYAIQNLVLSAMLKWFYNNYFIGFGVGLLSHVLENCDHCLRVLLSRSKLMVNLRECVVELSLKLRGDGSEKVIEAPDMSFHTLDHA